MANFLIVISVLCVSFLHLPATINSTLVKSILGQASIPLSRSIPTLPFSNSSSTNTSEPDPVPFGCLVPKDTNHITRAALLQQCLSKNKAAGNETRCYDELGCFPMDDPWTTLLRPLPTPYSPKEVGTTLRLFTRNSPKGKNVTLWPDINLKGLDFRNKRSKTVFITHGFASSGDSQWLIDMKDAYLSQVDANVFLVNWKNGSSLINYLQAASNTRIVGAELGRFLKYLTHKEHLELFRVHAIGHSLGAHISSYMAKEFNTTKIGRLTALDPAQPGFEGSSEKVRLSSDDADFVDVLHTDAELFLPYLGFGMITPHGHVDFYMNGGEGQPGCIKEALPDNITSIGDLASIPVEFISTLISCSHGRSYEYFTEAINSTNCTFWGTKMSDTETAIKVTAAATPIVGGIISKAADQLSSLDNCGPKNCTVIGLKTSSLPAHGSFAVTTSKKTPFCKLDKAPTSRELKEYAPELFTHI